MENSPLTSKVDAGKKESRKSKTRKLETIGSLAVKPKLPEKGSLERSPSARQPRGSQQAPEHIGHMLIDSEAKSVARPNQPVAEKRIDTLNRAELLSLSETIIIDGSSLRQIYETHLIGERGLRRLVAEHLHGGELKKALRREVTEREIDFERDPVMRDMVPVQALNTSAKTAALDELLKRATLSINDSNEETAFFKARAIYEASQLHQHKKQRRVIDISLAGFITVLIALIIVLYLSHK